ncbi:hypothetical protein CHARACLAT_024227 [Characodon lateralis]|uniref:Uncharacterized protein n=1 Tax=Characodon lateralis TaxID=208331 RepID=A0ABU7DJF7_9TELE|nr:hypothetical protein [Characodon lateralis]
MYIKIGAKAAMGHRDGKPSRHSNETTIPQGRSRRTEVWGWGGKDWGAKCSPRDPAPQLTPIGTSICRVPTKEGGTGTSTGPEARDRHWALRTHLKLGPTPPAPRNAPNPQTPIPSNDTLTLKPPSSAPNRSHNQASGATKQAPHQHRGGQ